MNQAEVYRLQDRMRSLWGSLDGLKMEMDDIERELGMAATTLDAAEGIPPPFDGGFAEFACTPEHATLPFPMHGRIVNIGVPKQLDVAAALALAGLGILKELCDDVEHGARFRNSLGDRAYNEVCEMIERVQAVKDDKVFLPFDERMRAEHSTLRESVIEALKGCPYCMGQHCRIDAHDMLKAGLGKDPKWIPE